MASVFVSHSSRDRAATERVLEQLRAAGFAAMFVDFDPEQGIPAGRNWERELYAQLRRTDAVIFLASEISVASRWCFAEVTMARSLGRPVFPLRLQAGVGLPLLDDVQWMELTDPEPPDTERGLARLLAGLRAAGLDPADSFSWDPHRSPYPGLVPFAFEDAAVFCGRRPETLRLVELLTPTLQHGPGRMVAVVGPSGSGKSSLVHAGLLPRLARMPERWLLVPPLRPGRRPTTALAGCLARAFAARGHPRPTEEVAAALAQGPSAGLVELAGQLADLAGNGAGRPGVLVVVDQAEELLTRTGAHEQQAFLEVLAGALHEDSPIWVVATLRSEFLSTAPDRAGLAEAVDDTLLIEPLSRNRLAEVIVRPAQRAGLDLEPGLVERMVEDTAGGDALPLLGYTLHELYQRAGPEGRITEADYEAVGGVVGALRHRADRLTDELRRRGLGQLVLPALLRLATVTGDEHPTRRRVRRSSFSAEKRVVADAFIDAALLVSSRDPADPGGEAVVEVAHEALLRQWPPLREAIEAERDLLQLRSDLERLAVDWQQGHRDDSYLLRGGRRATIDHWAAQHPGELGPLEHDFLEASRTLETRELAVRLAAATSAREVADVLVAGSRAAVGATGAALWLAAERRGTPRPGLSAPSVELVTVDGIPAERLGEMEAAAIGGMELVRGDGVHTVPLRAGLRAVWPGLAAVMGEAGQEALVVVPVDADSRHLGALVLVLGTSGDSELIDLPEPGQRGSLGRADADLLSTIGRQAGQALERVRLYEEATRVYEEAARAAERSAFLLDAARLTASAGDVTETAEQLAELAVPRLANVCVIDLAVEHGLVRAAARHGDPSRQALAAALEERHLPHQESPHPAVQAMEQGRTVWIREVTDRWLAEITIDEDQLGLARALQLVNLVCVPLLADGRVLGVLTLGSDRRRGPFTPADVETAEQLALQVSQVVDKAQRLELETRTSHTLQANLLPPAPPPVPGLSVAVRYLPASRGADVGGDFYDVVPLPGGQVALAVGDVVGHDIRAAAVMGQLRNVYRALLADRPPPSAVIDRLQAGWSLLGLQLMATALFAVLDPGSGRLRIASAGHLAPLLVAGGTAELLDVRPSRMLGAPPAPDPAVEWTGVLDPGATLLLYTDGLVARHGADLDEGLAALREVAVRADTTDPDELCDTVLAELASGVRADDVALLAITRRT